MPRTNLIDLSSRESSPIQDHPINTTLDTTLALLIPSSTLGQTNLTQGNIISPLAPKALVFSTSLNSPIEPHPYLASLDDLSPRSSNPQPQSHSQGLFQTLSLPTPMDFKPSFRPINLLNARISTQLEPFLWIRKPWEVPHAKHPASWLNETCSKLGKLEVTAEGAVTWRLTAVLVLVWRVVSPEVVVEWWLGLGLGYDDTVVIAGKSCWDLSFVGL
nr:hypothetical protein [Tanacetum cinerariifolium]GEV23260.1 hypothetical protein [Tanacetum cinerariifolium]